jgi:hypothetical protein
MASNGNGNGKDKKVRFEVDVDTAFRLDETLREALVSNGALPAVDNFDFRAGRIGIELDEKTAAFFSDMLRQGLIEAAAAHQANNISIADKVRRREV